MSTITLHLPESQHQLVREFASRQDISVAVFAELAIAEKLADLLKSDFLAQWVQGEDRTKFEQALANVGDAPPDPHDALE